MAEAKKHSCSLCHYRHPNRPRGSGVVVSLKAKKAGQAGKVQSRKVKKRKLDPQAAPLNGKISFWQSHPNWNGHDFVSVDINRKDGRQTVTC